MEEKNKGNEAMARQDFGAALLHYTKGIQEVESAAAEKQDKKNLLHILYSNRSQVQLNLKKYNDALSDANKALEIGGSAKAKATFRRALANKGLKEWDDAMEDLEGLLKLSESDRGGLEQDWLVANLREVSNAIDLIESNDRLSGERWLKKMAKESGVVKLPSGMLVKPLNLVPLTGKRKSPRVGDSCSVHYTGTLRNGSKFDSSRDRGEPSSFAPDQVIPGWTEALQLMCEGERWIVYIPFEMAYGKTGSPPAIPPFAPLCFDMELITVQSGGGEPIPARVALDGSLKAVS